MTTSPLRVALFGVGGIGHRHVEALVKLSREVEIVAACDLRQEAVDQALKTIGRPVPTSLDSRALAESVNCDYAVVVIPNPARLPVIERLLARRIPVFMEKPAAHSLADFERIVGWQQKAGVPVMVAQNYRFTPGARIVRRLLAEGAIGEIMHVHGRFQRAHFFAETLYYGRLPGALPLRIEMVVHHLDLVTSWLQSAPTAIVADGYRTPLSWGVGETATDILARFENGARLSYHGDWSTAVDSTSFIGHWVLSGTKGMIRWADGPVELRRRHPDRYNGEGETTLITPAANLPALFEAPHHEFIAAWREGRAPESNLGENSRSIRLCLQAAEQHCFG